MSVGEFCNREVIITEKSDSIREAINLMRTQHVGDVIVIEKRSGMNIPVGILTDRDIVVEILADDVDLNAVSIGDVMSHELLTIKEDSTLVDALKYMRDKGVRRAPIVDDYGALVGLLTVDDILEILNEQLSDLVALITHERTREEKQRS